MRDGELWMAKTTAPLALVWSYEDAELSALAPTMVVVSREPDGRWYVTFAVDTDAPDPMPVIGHQVGVDLGVKDFAVTSDGDRIANPKHLEKKQRILARYQRRMARCQPGSNNRRKAKAKVARAHRKVRDARADFLHRTSTGFVRRADTIVIEDLNISGMVRNAAKNILAAGRAVAGDTPGDVCGADVRRQGTSLPQSVAKQKHPRREP
ncbi:RNA-guided endonuclease InsQ/TnpB family protein [Actinomadura nitritigenes]|uniref:RNA-guided endonuclease InsQ/TnpB family protein n=1 Tax=Actinomadura nitritigenes TaxID=134602 RepID=UPI003D8B9B3A